MSDTERAILNELVLPDQQTGIVRIDAVEAIAEVIQRRITNTENGKAMINLLHRDCGSWATAAYLTGQKRMTLQRWGKKVVNPDAEVIPDDAD